MPARLRFTAGARSGDDLVLREPEAKIGRDPSLDIVIPIEDERFVSRTHAAITRESEGYVARDLESSNGTYVNGRRITRAVLADGDEIQFGRHGPVALFRCDLEYQQTVAEAGRAGAAVPPPLLPPQVLREPPSQVVRRIVQEAIATTGRRSRQRIAVVVATVGVCAAAAAFAMLRFGVFEGADLTFRRLADDYQGRVVLIEVGVNADGRYSQLGDGSGFFAGKDGLIVTNKHVVHTHLYDRDNACLAEAFRRRGLSFEKSLVITAWRGGTEFRQKPTSPRGDRSLGYSTENKKLSLVATAADTLMASTTIQCHDWFGGPDFTYAWRPHAMDNNDLAVLRASEDIEPIPLSDDEPRTDDSVMVFGFPTGMVPLETNKAEPIRRLGSVLRTRDTIQIDAVVLNGNSGGPLIDHRGKVVGVTTRGTAESLNMAIKVEHVRRLLERTRQAS